MADAMTIKPPARMPDTGARLQRVASYFTSGQRIMHGWNPPAMRADDSVRFAGFSATGRAIDGVHNSGWLSGAIEVNTALVVGTGLRLNAKPDARMLGWKPDFAAAWAREVEVRFGVWSNNPLECDASGKMTLGQMTASAFRAWFAHGEILASVEDIERIGAMSRTKIQVLDPLTLPRHGVRAGAQQGVVVDQFGFPVAYHFRVRDPNSLIERDHMVEARTETGRPLIVHVFDPSPGQLRGITPLAPALRVVRQFDQLADATLTAALIQTIFAASIRSPMPPEQIFEALRSINDGTDADDTTLGQYLKDSGDWYKNSKIDLGEHGRIAHLYPGEEFNFHSAQSPSDQYPEFSKGLLREIARCIPCTYETFSGDYRGATYSSVRMATSEHWPIMLHRRQNVASRLPQAAYEAWIEEEIALGRLGFPGGYDAFVAQRSAATQAQWRGPARPTADDQKTANAQIARISANLSTLADECAENGYDWEEVLQQRALEMRVTAELGLSIVPAEPVSGKSKGQQQGGSKFDEDEDPDQADADEMTQSERSMRNAG